MNQKLTNKYQHLKDHLAHLASAAVAFSAGVDSTFLLDVAHEVLGAQAVAFTAASPFVPQRDVDETAAFCRARGIEHVTVPFDTLAIPGITANPTDRCYLCKHALFSHMVALAKERGLAAVVDGSNLDDDGDYRPGRRALKELGIVSPLHAAGLTKADIRALSKERHLPTWDKPSFACLASRFAYGETLTRDALARVNAAEEFLMSKGFRQLRVRVHDDATLARIELLPEDLPRFLTAPGLREETSQHLKALGFRYVAVDLQGFRSGSMNAGMGR